MGGRILAAAVLAAAAAIALGRVHPFGDPRQGAGPADRGGLLSDGSIPAPAKAVLVAKCADCHSNATQWPLYARIAPASWLVERDVVEGRAHMNLSAWAGLTADRRQVIEAMIVHQTRSGEMPPLQYRAIHWRANLSAADLQALAMLDPQQGAAEVGSGSAGDANRGKALFEKRCTGCHALDSDREGPRLRGVFGRRAGSIPNFTYSPAVKASGITWNQDSLNKWLTDTDAMIPGNNMDFSVPKSAERADIIEYLRQLK